MKTIFTFLLSISFLFSNAQNWTAVGKSVINFNGLNSHNIELYEFDNKLFAGGFFTEISGVNANAVAYYDGLEWHAMEFSGPIPISMKSFASYKGKLYAFAEYVAASVIDNSILEFDIVTNTWYPVAESEVFSNFSSVTTEILDMIEYEEELYIAGNFDFIGEVEAKNIAKWNGTEWERVVGGGGRILNSIILDDLHIFDNELFITGGSIYINNNFTRFTAIIKWDGANFEFPDDGLVTPSGGFFIGTQNMIEFRNELYVAGTSGLTTNPMLTGYSLYKWNGEIWQGVIGFDLTNRKVEDIAGLAVFGDNLYLSTYNYDIFIFDGKEINKLDEELRGSKSSLVVYDNHLFCAGNHYEGLIPDGVFRLIQKTSTTSETERIAVFPNPNKGSFNVGYRQFTSDTQLILTNANGEQIFNRIYKEEDGLYLKNLNFANIPSGVYFLKVIINEYEETKKILVID